MENEAKNELIVALCKAKLEFEPITKDGKAKTEKFSYDYASLDMIIKATDKALANNGLNIRHYIESKEDKMVLVTELRHISGCTPDRTETPIERFVDAGGRMSAIQSFGSALTYLRRYHMGLLLNIAIDEADDGKEAGKTQQPKGQPKSNFQNDNSQASIMLEIAKKRAFVISKWLGNTDEEMAEDCHLQFNIKSRAELTAEQWNEYVKTLQEYESQLIDDAQLEVMSNILSKKIDKYPKGISDPAFNEYYNRFLKAYYDQNKKDFTPIALSKELRKWQAKVLISKMMAKVEKVDNETA